ncbi:STAS domain-containing protein [Brevibacillus fluminis]|uniref:STAS domain-containing protein n=1 Tax=Brevibacillus fluminis TaxID=511487 RepID=UPI003F8C8E6B
MAYRVNEVAQHVTIYLEGELDMSVGEKVGQFILHYGEKYPSVTLDFTDVTFVDSSGIGSLFYTTKDLLAQDKQIEIVNVQEDIYDVLCVIGFVEALGVSIKQVEPKV